MTAEVTAAATALVTVNGRPYPLGDVGGHVTLLEWLRGTGFTGCKEGCAEGECGACAVLVARPDGESGSRWTAVNSCLVPAAGLQDQEVITAEGLGEPDRMRTLYAAYVDAGGPGRLADRGDLTMLVAQLGNIARVGCERWLTSSTDQERAGNAAWVREFLDEPVTVESVDRILLAVNA